MGYFPVRYDSRVVIYERKMFIRLATEQAMMVDGRRSLICGGIKYCIPSPRFRVGSRGSVVMEGDSCYKGQEF